eukprot:gene14804-22561_t
MLLPWLRRATPTFPTGPAATAMSARSRSSSSSIRRTWVIMALGFLQTLNMAAGEDAVHTGEPSTCYELAYGPDGESRALIKPITTIPEGHLLANGEDVCGASYQAGDAIPASALWNNHAARNNIGCHEVSGGNLFFSYRYGSPLCTSGWCTNTGFTAPGTEILYFTEDVEGNVNLVVSHDQMASGIMGNAKMFIQAAGLANAGVSVQQFDDHKAKNASQP